MVISGYLSLLVCILGAIFYFITTKPKAEKVAWHMFFWGLIFWLYCTCGAHFQLGVTGR